MEHLNTFEQYEINEMKKSTWNSASDKSIKKGLYGLGDKFKKWGEEHGTGPEFPIKLVTRNGRNQIILYPFVDGADLPYFKSNGGNKYTGNKVVGDEGKSKTNNIQFDVSSEGNELDVESIWIYDVAYKCADRLSANTFIKAFSMTKKVDIKTDPRKLIYGY